MHNPEFSCQDVITLYTVDKAIRFLCAREMDLGLKKLLIIDDDKVVITAFSKMVEEFYHLKSAKTGLEGIKLAREYKPDVIVLDVEMPGMNGYEVCDTLKHDDRTKGIPVIFVSSHRGLHERMLGYEAGASDFVVKPFEPDELLAKIRTQCKVLEEHSNLSKKVDFASKTAFTAMRGSSELGVAIQFIESTYAAKNFRDIADKFLNVTQELGLNCTLMFKTDAGLVYFSIQEDVPPLEKEVISTLHCSGDRFNDFGCRTQINYQRVALLVKNMPLQDPEAYGRFKDFLPTMLGSTDARIKSMELEKALVDQTRNLSQSFGVVRDTLISLGENLEGNQTQVLKLLKRTIDELENKIPTMGLEDDQEKYLIDTLDKAIQVAHTITDSSESASSAFQTVCRLLDHLSIRQQSVLDHALQNSTEVPTQEIKVTGEIELF